MTKTTQVRSLHQATEETEAVMNDVAEMNGSLIKSYVGASQKILQGAVGLNQEMMRFAGERLEADMEALQQLSQCTNWPAFMNFQSSFARSAVEAYQNEMTKLADLTSKATAATWQPLYQLAKTEKGTSPAE
jgi:hypothetical protein